MILLQTMTEATSPALFNPPLITLLPDFVPTTIYPLPSEVGRVEVSDVCIGYTTMEGMLLDTKFISYGVTVEMTLHTFNSRKERLGTLQWGMVHHQLVSLIFVGRCFPRLWRFEVEGRPDSDPGREQSGTAARHCHVRDIIFSDPSIYD
jgi:hypothetical protein